MITTFSEVAEASAEPVRIVLDEGEGWSDDLLIEQCDGTIELHRVMIEDGRRPKRQLIALSRDDARAMALAVLAMVGEG